MEEFPKCFSGSTIFLPCVNYVKTTGETIKLNWSVLFNTQVTDSSVECKVRRVLGPSHYHLVFFVILGNWAQGGRPLRRGHVLPTGVAHCC